MARYILAMRSSPVRYPVYLTDLDLSAQYGEQLLSTGHYWQHKLQLEAALNRAVAGV
ncbi:MAG: hypothetical protein HYV16_14305 [Gammaproteobacteria bacterium]|nr:hypothetical protein [Gammaproteobacteria bacterium]